MEKLEKVMNNYGSPMFCMSATHLMEIGFREAENITDEDIDKMVSNERRKQDEEGGIFLMTPEFMGNIVRCARDIAQNTTPVKLMQFFISRELFEPEGRMRYDRIKEYLANAIEFMATYNDMLNPEIAKAIGMDEEELEEVLGW